MKEFRVTYTNHESLVIAEHDGKLYVCADNLAMLSEKAFGDQLTALGYDVTDNLVSQIKNFVPKFGDKDEITVTFQY